VLGSILKETILLNNVKYKYYPLKEISPYATLPEIIVKCSNSKSGSLM
jgi:hypothetical protein